MRPSPREAFATHLRLLFDDAGKPTLDSVANQATKRSAHGVTTKRLSAWRRGDNLPQWNRQLHPVLIVLIEEARKKTPTPTEPHRYDYPWWQALHHAALQTPAPVTVRRRGSEDSEASTTEAAPAVAAIVAEAVEEHCPYRGLDSFKATDAADFFGRESSTAALVHQLDKATDTGGITMLVASSGAGKSSLVQAGLIAQLASNALPGSENWPIVLVTPGEHPLDRIAAAIPDLAQVLPPPGTRHPDDQQPLPVEIAEPLRKAVRDYLTRKASPEARLVLIVDQLEELFTICESDDERERFACVLAAVSTTENPGMDPIPALVLACIRADFTEPCLEYRPLANAYRDRQFVLESMTTSELRSAITGPARRAGLSVEPALVDHLLSEISGRGRTGGRAWGRRSDPGLLPLLSHALLATWQHRRAGKLTLEGYHRVGRIEKAVARTAEKTWERLDPADQAAAMTVLLRLTRLGEDSSQDARDRHDKQQLITQAPDPEGTERALEQLLAARLLTTDSADNVQIIHEALLHAWPRLRAYLDDHRDGLVLLQRLERQIADWETDSRSDDRLLRGTELASTQAWIDKIDTSHVSADVRNFLALSHQNQTTRRNRARHLRMAAVAGVVVIAMFAVSLFFLWQEARHREQEAIFEGTVAQADRMHNSDFALEALLDVSAYRMRPTPYLWTKLLETEGLALSSPLRGHSLAVNQVTFSPDGRIVASASADHTVRLWNATDPAHPMIGSPLAQHTSDANTVSFSPDGHLLATAGDDSTVRLWNIADPARAAEIGGPLTLPSGVNSVVISPDGRTLAAGTRREGRIYLWNIADPARPIPLGQPFLGHDPQQPDTDVNTVAFSPDGQVLASGADDGTARLWNIADPARPVALGSLVHGGGVNSVAFSRDGRILATASADHMMRLWSLADPAHASLLGLQTAGSGPVLGVAVSSDGTVATADDDHTVRLWNAADPTHPTPLGPPLVGSSGPVWKVSFSPDGRTLASASEDGNVRMWTIPTVETGHTGGINAVAFSRDGRTLASASDDHSVRLYNLADPTHPVPVGQPLSAGGGVTGVALSSDGTLLALGSDDSALRLWYIADPSHPVPIGQPVPSFEPVSSLAMSPDGRALATTSGDSRTVRLWNISAARGGNTSGVSSVAFSPYNVGVVDALARPGFGEGTLAFSPDGRTLVTGGNNYALRLWNVTDLNNPTPIGQPILGHLRLVRAVAFSPDGRTLASAGDDDSVRLWDISDPNHGRQLAMLTDNTSSVNAVGISPDGRTLASGGKDNTVRLWDMTDRDHPVSIGAPLTAHTDAVQALAFDPAAPTLASAGRDATLRVWNLDAEAAIHRICASTNNAVDPAEWAQIFPNVPFAPPCVGGDHQ